MSNLKMPNTARIIIALLLIILIFLDIGFLIIPNFYSILPSEDAYSLSVILDEEKVIGAESIKFFKKVSQDTEDYFGFIEFNDSNTYVRVRVLSQENDSSEFQAISLDNYEYKIIVEEGFVSVELIDTSFSEKTDDEAELGGELP